MFGRALYPGGGVVNLSHRRPEFESRVVHVGFVVNKVVPAHLSLWILRVSPVKIFSPTLHTHISFIYLRHYKILAIDSIIKSPTKKISHIQFVPSITSKDIILKPEKIRSKSPLYLQLKSVFGIRQDEMSWNNSMWIKIQQMQHYADIYSLQN